jgi:hypothetical protein
VNEARRGKTPIGAKIRGGTILSGVIVRVCGRSSNHRTSGLVWFRFNPPCRDYWMPRLKRGMTTESPSIEGPYAIHDDE